MTLEYKSTFLTPFGAGEVHASPHGILRVVLPDLSLISVLHQETDPEPGSSSLTICASELLKKYFMGEHIDFDDIPVDLSGIPPFRCRAMRVIRSIPYGEVRSYKMIAAECGSPRAARAVGGAMASNPVPVIIPCHRVVASSGRLTGFSSPGGVMSKIILLKMEGVEFKGLLAIQKQLVMNR